VTVLDPDEFVIGRERIRRALSGLSPLQRRLVMLVAQGHTAPEIGALLSMTPHAVEQALYLIRRTSRASELE
jgi:DNA-binding CsgD family transcriptional regulator